MPVDTDFDVLDQEISRKSALRDMRRKELEEILAQQPERAKGVRGVLGNILSIAGPMLGRGIGEGVAYGGDRLLNPGRDAWEQKLSKAKAQYGLADQDLLRADTDFNRRALIDDRNTQREISRLNLIRQQMNDFERAKGEQIMEGPSYNLSRREVPAMTSIDSLPQHAGGNRSPGDVVQFEGKGYRLKEQQPDGRWTSEPVPTAASEAHALPTTRPTLTEGLSARNMINPATGRPYSAEGSIKDLKDPRTKEVLGSYMLPSEATLAERAQATHKINLKNAQEIKEAGYRTVTPEMLAWAPRIGKKVGEKISDEDFRHFIQTDGWDEAAETTDDEGRTTLTLRKKGTDQIKKVDLGIIGKKYHEPQGPTGSFQPELDASGVVQRYFNPTTGQEVDRSGVGARRGAVPAIPVSVQDKLAGLDIAEGQYKKVQQMISDNSHATKGPLWGRVSNLQLNQLGGWGTTQEEKELAVWLRKLFQTSAFAEGGKQLTEGEKEQFHYTIPENIDTVEAAMNKIKVNMEAIQQARAARLKYITPAQREQLGGGAQTTEAPTTPTGGVKTAEDFWNKYPNLRPPR